MDAYEKTTLVDGKVNLRRTNVSKLFCEIVSIIQRFNSQQFENGRFGSLNKLPCMTDNSGKGNNEDNWDLEYLFQKSSSNSSSSIPIEKSVSIDDDESPLPAKCKRKDNSPSTRIDACHPVATRSHGYNLRNKSSQQTHFQAAL